MLTKIIIYGKLRKLLGVKEFLAKLNNAKQVFSFLTANYPQAAKEILNMSYAIKLNDKYISKEQIEYPLGNKILRLVPIAKGSSSSFYETNYTPYNDPEDYSYTFSAKDSFGGGSQPSQSFSVPQQQPSFADKVENFITTQATNYITNQVTNMATNTVQNYLQPQPQPVNTSILPTAAKDKSFNASFNGISNTINAGVAVPICLGETFTGSIIISASLDTVQYTGKGLET